ncbi:MAG: cytochrome c oxidase accessory protein CcoG [Candidatus Eisenbacteria bacterium]|nr:cytochrome c oxidase accessory protein CcoG [Candidatus Eisenbacteria bacterium]
MSAPDPSGAGSSGRGATGPRRPDMDTVFLFNEDGTRNFLHPADVSGRWQTRKQIVWAVLLLVYLVLPWVKVGGHPAIHLDIPGRQAFFFGLTFTNQDFYLMFFLLSGIGFTLFVLTSLWGRIWCGYACPQTVFLEGVFRRIERWLEGPREVRIRRNQGPWSGDKLGRKLSKWAIYLVLCFGIAHAFMAYFIPAEELLSVVRGSPTAHWTAFLWVMAMTTLLMVDMSWFREQVCVVVCPYGRLQSALIDADTIQIGYDKQRGEPRGKAGTTTGDCVDCFRCVAVCPTGIDIRNGTQLECVGCTNCIDACDSVMKKLGRPEGLVRYDSLRGFEGKRRGLLRPRAFVYAFLGLLGLSVATFAASHRSTFEANLMRAKGLPYELGETSIRNLITMHLQNKTGEARTYFVAPALSEEAEELDPEFIIPEKRVHIPAMGDVKIPLFVTVSREKYEEAFELSFAVTDSATGKVKPVKAKFLGP